MNCKYCNQELTKIHEERDSTKSYILDLICQVCHVHFEYGVSDLEVPVLLVECFYNIHIKDKEFEVQFQYFIGTIIKRIQDNPKYGEPMELKTIKSIVFSLKQFPKWTPFNIKEKLELLLPFV